MTDLTSSPLPPPVNTGGPAVLPPTQEGANANAAEGSGVAGLVAPPASTVSQSSDAPAPLPPTPAETPQTVAPGTAVPPVPPSPLSPFAALNAKQTAKKLNKAVEDTIAMRKHLWPDIGDELLWLVGDSKKKGFSPIPRPVPILMNMIGDASKHVSAKSVPAGRSYLVLWCRVFGEALVKIDNEMVAASEAGYSGERSVSTWREHMRVLKELGFIDYRPGAAGPMHFILLLNPYKVAMQLRAKGWIQEVQYTALFHRAREIGAGSELIE
ncbi:hypothetical protein [Variovorax boronicumulans]